MVTTIYVSCSSNCQPNAVDWARNGLICYAFSNAIAIYDPHCHITGRVLKTYHKHLSQVKVVQWIQSDNDEFGTEILSGSLDGTIVIWSKAKDSNIYSASTVLTLGADLTTTHAVYFEKNEVGNNIRSILVCACSFNNVFTIWLRDASGSIHSKQDLDLKKRISTAVRMAYLPGPTRIPILIIALDDATIHMFAWENSNNNTEIDFVHVNKLTGHQGWIQCMDIAQNNKNEALLASGSQDGTIRLWKIIFLTDCEKIADERMNQFMVGDNSYGISVESVLSGHDHWVNGVHWRPTTLDNNGDRNRPLKLLSTALDTTMIIWEPNANGVWVETVRLGKVDGNAIGYYGCKFNNAGSSVIAQGYQGTLHMWMYDEISKNWLPRTAPSGHFREVTDLHWDPQGKYLITTSSDKTTRIHVPWQRVEAKENEVWHEIARPQIHGYDINCLAPLSSTMFASGADEKVVRIFEAPKYFVQSLFSDAWINPRKCADNASVPALGLTNKTHHFNELKEYYSQEHVKCDDRPPTEEEIIRHTLWPESEKLYGHGYEIFAMSARHDGKLLATASKSTSVEYSSIILWSTKNWAQIQKLPGHRLTVTQMAFSPDDKSLVSVSRDRRWALYRCIESSNIENTKYELVGMSPKDNPLHTRIIWCCAWTHDSKYFATGSRDGKIGIWTVECQSNSYDTKLVTSLVMKDVSITALAFAPQFLHPDIFFLAIGFDDGVIEIQKILFNDANVTWMKCHRMDTSQAHHKTVRKLAFRPTLESGFIQLASCSSDNAVKIHKIDIQ